MEQNALNFCKTKCSSSSFISNKLITTLMLNGKKKASKKLLSISYKNLNKKSKRKGISIVICSLINSLPILSVKTLKNFNKKKFRYVPFFMLRNYRTRSAVKILLSQHQTKNKRLTSETLVNYLLNPGKLENLSLKNNYKIVFENKKFANYRWF